MSTLCARINKTLVTAARSAVERSDVDWYR